MAILNDIRYNRIKTGLLYRIKKGCTSLALMAYGKARIIGTYT